MWLRHAEASVVSLASAFFTVPKRSKRPLLSNAQPSNRGGALGPLPRRFFSSRENAILISIWGCGATAPCSVKRRVQDCKEDIGKSSSVQKTSFFHRDKSVARIFSGANEKRAVLPEMYRKKRRMAGKAYQITVDADCRILYNSHKLI